MEPPRRVGDWVLERFLGEGGYGQVELGVHQVSNVKAALKFIPFEKIRSETSKLTIQREVDTMQRLDHPNVLKLYECHPEVGYTDPKRQTKRAIMLVIELASKGELFHFLSYTGAFEEPVARSYFHQLINGIDHCHQQGVVHRDLKPENLLLNDAYMLKIADFGFAAIADEGKRFQTECGTKQYMAPEVLRHNYSGQASDVFACGVVLFIMLAGFPPFNKAATGDWWYERIMERRHALFWEAHSRTVRFSSDAKDLINRMLEPNPEQRITVEGIREHPWFKGVVYNHQSLAAQLSNRYQTVELKKQEERNKLRAKAKQINEAAVAAAGVTNAHRSHVAVPSVEELPSVSCYTKFETALNPSYVLDLITQTITKVYSGQMIDQLSDDVQYKRVFEVESENQDMIEFEVSIFKAEDTSNDAPIYLVRFSRLKGDCFEYHKLFNNLMEAVNGEEEEDCVSGSSNSMDSSVAASTAAQVSPFHFSLPSQSAVSH